MLNDDLKIILESLKERDEDVQKHALDMLIENVRSNAGTITQEQQDLLDVITQLKDLLFKYKGNNRALLSDIISVLSIGGSEESVRDVLLYRMEGNVTNLEMWGHQYVKQLVLGCIKVRTKEIDVINYSKIVEPITEYFFKHNSEVEAIDYLLEISGLEGSTLCNLNIMPELGTEVNKLDLIEKHVDESNFNRVYLYLLEINRFYDLRELILNIVKNKPSLYLVHLIEYRMFKDAVEYVKQIKEEDVKRQLLYILARCNISYETKNEDELFILENRHIAKNFKETNEDLEILNAAKIDYILKGLNTEKVDAAAVCNGLIHFGFMRDPLFERVEGDYLIKADYISMLKQCATKTINASIGCVYGFNPSLLIERSSSNIFEIKDLGTILGLAISSTKMKDNDKIIFDLLCDFLSSEQVSDILAALYGISLVYSGTIGNNFEFIYEKLFPMLNHLNADVVCLTIYTISSIFYGNVPETFLILCCDILSENNLNQSTFYLYAVLGLGLAFYKREDLYETEIYNKLPRHIQNLAYGLIYIGSGSPEKIEELMNNSFAGECEPINEILGLISCALIGLGDSLASNMIENQLLSALHLNNMHIKKVVPLCLSILFASTNKASVVEYLERSIHGAEVEIASAVALGIVGAGTKNSRILSIMSTAFNLMYKDLAESSALIYSQGLVNLGKGTLSLSPLAYNERVIIDKSVIGLLNIVMMIMSEGYSCFKENSFLMYGIVQSIMPKYVTGVDCEIKIGKPVEIVGLSGNPTKISGKVLHQSPVILNVGEMAETDVEMCTEFIEDILVEKK